MSASRLSALVLAAAAVACGKSSSTAPSNDTGSLAVTITAPAGVSASVSVSGPDGFLQQISATRTLSGLAPGSYMVTAAAGSAADGIVGVPYSGTVTGSPASVTAGATANATVTYTQRANEGLVWVASIGSGAVSGFTSAQLAASGSPSPAVALSVKGAKLAVDASGGMWVSYFTRDTLYYFTQAQLLAGGSPAPTIKIATTSGGSLSQPTGMAFDARGDLWVANRASNTLVEFTPQQLAASGAPAPVVTIVSLFGSLNTPWSIAFDAHGALWVACFGDSVVSGYSAAQLAAGGAVFPDAGISNTLGGGVMGIAFDAAGNLWVASLSGAVSKFTPDQLTTVGAPVPSVVITSATLVTPGVVAFDASGSMWVAEESPGYIAKYTAAQLAVSGSPVPATIVHGGGGSISEPTDIVFSPHAAGLPMH